MSPPNPQIICAVKLRKDKYTTNLVSIYWRERTPGGQTSQRSFYWGKLPTKRLEKLLAWIAKPPHRNVRKRICRLLGVKESELRVERLRDPDFLKTQILGRLKEIEQRPKHICQLSPEKQEAWREAAVAINAGMQKFREMGTSYIQGIIKTANDHREIGRQLELACNRKRLSTGTYLRLLKPNLPEGMTLDYCRLAMSIWRGNPEPIKDYWDAKPIVKRLGMLERSTLGTSNPSETL